MLAPLRFRTLAHMTADRIIRKKVATHISPELHKAFGILLQIDDVTMDEFLRRQIESYVSDHKHANAVAHIIREPKSPAALEAIAKIQKGRGR